MAFPETPNVGDQHELPGGSTYEFTYKGVWKVAFASDPVAALRDDTTTAIAAMLALHADMVTREMKGALT